MPLELSFQGRSRFKSLDGRFQYPATTSTRQGDEDAFGAQLDDLMAQRTGPIVMWNPYNPWADMASSTSSEAWQFNARQAESTRTLCETQWQGAPMPPRPEKVFARRLVNLSQQREEREERAAASNALCAQKWIVGEDHMVVRNLSGEEVLILIEEQMTVGDVKREVMKLCGIRCEEQTLCMNESPLTDDLVLHTMVDDINTYGFLLINSGLCTVCKKYRAEWPVFPEVAIFCEKCVCPACHNASLTHGFHDERVDGCGISFNYWS